MGVKVSPQLASILLTPTCTTLEWKTQKVIHARISHLTKAFTPLLSQSVLRIKLSLSHLIPANPCHLLHTLECAVLLPHILSRSTRSTYPYPAFTCELKGAVLRAAFVTTTPQVALLLFSP